MINLQKTPTQATQTTTQKKFNRVQAINRLATALDKFKAAVKSVTSTENGYTTLKSNFKNH